MFKELFIENYKLQDFQKYLRKENIPFKSKENRIEIPSRFYDKVKNISKKFQDNFEIIDGRDVISVKIV